MAVATEDEPSEEAAVRLVSEVGATVSMRLRKGGFGYLKSRVRNFSQMARHHPVLLLTDLDCAACPVQLRDDWLNGLHRPDHFFLRIVVREIESWLFADRAGLSDYLEVSVRHLPDDPEALPDPKLKMLEVAARARKDIRNDMVAQRGQVAAQGLGYNARLVRFIQNHWDIRVAASVAPSLGSALTRLESANL